MEASSKYPPYAKREIIIGAPVCAEKDKREQKRAELAQALEEIKKIEQYIEGVEDARLQEILTRRIIYGEMWAEIAAALGYGSSPDNTKKAYYRHFF